MTIVCVIRKISNKNFEQCFLNSPKLLICMALFFCNDFAEPRAANLLCDRFRRDMKNKNEFSNKINDLET